MPKIKLILDSLEGTDEGLKALYEKGEDGKFRLNVDGIEEQSGLLKKNAELLDEKKKAVERQKELENKLKGFEGIDPEEAKKLLETQRKIKEKELIDQGQIDQLISERLAALQRDHENKVKHLAEALEKSETDKSKFRESLNKITIDKGIMEAINAVGTPRKEALQDILNRARSIWKVDEEGNPKAYDSEGNIRFGKDPKKEMTMADWAEEIVQLASHLFEESKGGGAKGTINLPGGQKINEELLASMSPTEKMTMGRKMLNSGK